MRIDSAPTLRVEPDRSVRDYAAQLRTSPASELCQRFTSHESRVTSHESRLGDTA